MTKKITMLKIVLIIAAYSIVVLLTTFLLEPKTEKRMGLFIFCYILTPISGIIKVMIKKMKESRAYKQIRYKCSNCGFHFFDIQENCPLCLDKGHKIKLKKCIVMFL